MVTGGFEGLLEIDEDSWSRIGGYVVHEEPPKEGDAGPKCRRPPDLGKGPRNSGGGSEVAKELLCPGQGMVVAELAQLMFETPQVQGGGLRRDRGERDVQKGSVCGTAVSYERGSMGSVAGIAASSLVAPG